MKRCIQCSHRTIVTGENFSTPKKSLSQYNFIHHRPQMDWPGMKRGLCFETASNWLPQPRHGWNALYRQILVKLDLHEYPEVPEFLHECGWTNTLQINRHTFATFHCEHVQNNNMTENYIQTSRLTHLHILIISITLLPSANVTNLLSEARTTWLNMCCCCCCCCWCCCCCCCCCCCWCSTNCVSLLANPTDPSAGSYATCGAWCSATSSAARR